MNSPERFEAPIVHEPTVIFPPRYKILEFTPEEQNGWAGAAKGFVGEEYTKLHRDFDPGEERLKSPAYSELRDKVTKRLSEDEYSRRPSTRIFVALTHDNEFAGTIRVGRGQVRPKKLKPEEEHFPLETMQLEEPLNKKDWQRHLKGLPVDQFFEIARTTVNPEQRELGNTQAVIHSLIDGDGGVVDTLQREGLTHGFITAQNRLRQRLIETDGLIFEERIPMRLRTEDPYAAAIFHDFPKYWGHVADPPQLYSLRIRPKKAA